MSDPHADQHADGYDGHTGGVVSDDGLLVEDFGEDTRRRGWMGCLAVLVVVALVLAGVYVGLTRGIEELRERLGAGPEDYAGPGTGRVLFEVAQGDTITRMGEGLEEQGVVASVDAFVEAAAEEPRASRIQPGHYQLKEEMAAADALAVLVDPANMVTTTVTVPEGLRAVDVAALLAEKTDFKRERFLALVNRPRGLGLPKGAQGRVEGYLFPATYAFGPKATPQTMLKAMVDRWKDAAAEVDLAGAAQRLGYSQHELMTLASLVEAEATPEYMPQVARVLYNRMEIPDNGTGGLLQLDATVNYAHGNKLGARTSAEERQIDSPYNTYRYPGLPPGPIEAPGLAAMKAVVQPADGGWLYYVTVNLRTGETKFAETLDEHNTYVEELDDYCRNESERC